MKLDEILDAWDQDSEVDPNDLSTASLTTARLHSKYLRLLINAKMRKSKVSSDFSGLRRLKTRYYRGELTQQELEDNGWDPWQYNKPLKAEMEEVLRGDDDICKMQNRVDYLDTMIQALDAILGQLKQRDWAIKNAIAFKQLMAGN